MNDRIPDKVEELVDELLLWMSKMPTIAFCIYGSRARGDHQSA
jgi:hypothetical protein